MSKKTNVDRVREAKELERAKARPRSVDNDILFSLPLTKAMLAALAAGVVCYVLSYIGEAGGIEVLARYGRIASYALFACTFFLLVVARVQGKRLTQRRRAEEQKVATVQASGEKRRRRRKKRRS